MQGPIPSFTQMILPQLRQLGAAAKSGWRVARQSHRRDEGEVLVEREGLVWSSRARMAESRSWRVVEAPCIEGPPERAILVLGRGDEERLVDREDEISGPDAEGGSLEVGVGAWRAAGLSERARAFASGGSFRGRDAPGM